jgi:hypothetical protein
MEWDGKGQTKHAGRVLRSRCSRLYRTQTQSDSQTLLQTWEDPEFTLVVHVSELFANSCLHNNTILSLP